MQFSISTQFSSIWFIDRNLLGATTLGQSEPGGDGNEEALCIPQDTRWGSHIIMQRSCWCILQPQTTGQGIEWT